MLMTGILIKDYEKLSLTLEKILGKQKSWCNNWVNSSRTEIEVKNLKKKYIKKSRLE